MSRVLQLRRGTTAENDNFTGLSGEVTFDTTTKTLRVHDGATLGGFTLARADVATSAGDVDLTTVPDDVWAEIFATHSPAAYTTQTSELCSIPTSSGLEYVFTGSSLPFSVQTTLVCQTAEAGYNAGDEVAAFGIGTYANPSPNVYVQNGAIHVVLLTDGATFWVANNVTGTPTNITNDNWRLRFRVYC